MNQNRSIRRLVIPASFLILILAAAILLFKGWKSSQAQIGHRTLLQRLGYCSSPQVKPCVLSFNLAPDGTMVIGVLTDSASSTDFHLKVRHGAGETLYECQQVNGSANHFACIGETLPPGEAVQFLMISGDEVLLAEGKFSIIGLAMTTPEFALAGATEEAPLNPLSSDDSFPATQAPTSISPNNGTAPLFPTNASVATPTSTGDFSDIFPSMNASTATSTSSVDLSDIFPPTSNASVATPTLSGNLFPE